MTSNLVPFAKFIIYFIIFLVVLIKFIMYKLNNLIIKN